MPKKNFIAWIHLKGGPHDGKWVRMEGEIHPSIFIFGDHETPESTMSAYAAVDLQATGHYHDYQFTGQIDSEVLPPFLWLPDTNPEKEE